MAISDENKDNYDGPQPVSLVSKLLPRAGKSDTEEPIQINGSNAQQQNMMNMMMMLIMSSILNWCGAPESKKKFHCQH
jgi:hypothetical protein